MAGNFLVSNRLLSSQEGLWWS